MERNKPPAPFTTTLVKRLVTKKNKLFIDDISAEILVHAITFLKKRGQERFPRIETDRG